MSSYFKQFPKVLYKFGDETSSVTWQHLGTYIDLIDQLKEEKTYYEKYYIQEGDRPDVVSQKLYDNSSYGWTFFLLNDKLRVSGWPVSSYRLSELAKKYYPNIVVSTDSTSYPSSTGVATPLSLSAYFKEGNYVLLSSVGIPVKIIKIDHDMGQIFLDYPSVTSDIALSAISTEEALSILDGSLAAVDATVLDLVDVFRMYQQYNAPAYFLNGNGERITPSWSSTYPHTMDQTTILSSTIVTYFDHITAVNDAQKDIKILKKDVVPQLVAQFTRLLQE